MEAEEEQFNKRVDVEMQALEINMNYIIKASKLRGGGKDDKLLSQDLSAFTATQLQQFQQQQDELPVKDKYKISQEKLLLEASTANIIRATESLLSLTSELRSLLLLNDFKRLNTHLSKRFVQLDSQQKKYWAEMNALKVDLSSLVHTMETVYSSSPYIAVSDDKRIPQNALSSMPIT